MRAKRMTASAHVSDALSRALEECHREMTRTTEGGVEMILSPRLADYLHTLLVEQGDERAEAILDLLKGDEEPLADVIELPAQGKSAGQEVDPTSYTFWYGR